MLHDLNAGIRDGEPEVYDLCIAGGGMAGITIGVALAARGHKVAILEGGGLEWEERSQELYRGAILGRSYFALDEARLRYLGGTSNVWSGMCSPLDPIDFRVQPQIPMSGWPIDHTSLSPYLGPVCDILEIENSFADMPLPAPSDDIKRIAFQFSEPPVLFAQKYMKQLEEDERITCYLNANLVDIAIDEASGRVASFEVANYANREQKHGFRARYFVLALGGIENARAMLASRSQIESGIGNQQDLVGRYFIDHFHAFGGYYATQQEIWPFEDVEVHLGPTEAYQEANKIGNAGVRVQPLNRPTGGASRELFKDVLCYSELVADLVNLVEPMRCEGRAGGGGMILVASEQVPNPDSRVVLMDETDPFGLPKVGVDWQILEVDRHTIIESVKMVAKYLARNGYGNIKLADWIMEGRDVPGVGESEWLGAGWHHIGTTRMSDSPETGVVDADARVFGHDNLFLAGSSVFTTAGHANPSFTILQLALRLSDHLDGLLKA